MSDKVWKEGDTVYFYKSPGVIDEQTIHAVNQDGSLYQMQGCKGLIHEGSFFRTREEAEATLSHDGQRLAGCFEEADRIHSKAVSKGHLNMVRRQTDVMQIAFKLFDAGGD